VLSSDFWMRSNFVDGMRGMLMEFTVRNIRFCRVRVRLSLLLSLLLPLLLPL
jgi:hypothetical protein